MCKGHAICLILSFTLSGIGCMSEPASKDASVSGSATFRERMALPAGAVFEATLEDVSRADAPADVLGRARIRSPGDPPIPFTISYDPRRIEGENLELLDSSLGSVAQFEARALK